MKNTFLSAGKRGESISGACVFFLLGVFAMFAVFLVLLSAQTYRGVINSGEAAADKRLLHHYIVNAVNGNDFTSSISIQEQNGKKRLALMTAPDSEAWLVIYEHNGVLREMYAFQGEDFIPEYGEAIVSVKSFSPRLENGMLIIEIVDQYGVSDTIHVALQTAQEGA